MAKSITFPILELEQAEITSLFSDPRSGNLLVGLSDGRILEVDTVETTAWMTGARRLYAQVEDGMGCQSSPVSTPILFQLQNAVTKVSLEKSVTVNSVSIPVSASQYEQAEGVFITPVLTGEDLFSWTTMAWTHAGSSVKAYARTSDSAETISSKEWIEIEPEVNNLSFLSPNEPYIQAKIVLSSLSKLVFPIMMSLSIGYKSAHAVYFFTKKFVLERGSEPQSIVLTANFDQPVNTKVEFGITDSNSAEWKDYTIIDLGKIRELTGMTGRMKVGAKLVSYDTTNYAVVDEFAIMFKDGKDSILQ